MKSKIKISDEKALSIIHKPLLTEKSTNLNQFNQYTFVVDKKSNSYDIQQAIEKIFKVKVTKQNLKVIDIDEENKLLIVNGSVPGRKNSVVFVKDSIKKN